MKTSWNDIELIERYLDRTLSAEESEVFSLRLMSDRPFKANVLAQSRARSLVRKHYLIQMRTQLKELHKQLYNDPARRPLRQAIEALFTR